MKARQVFTAFDRDVSEHGWAYCSLCGFRLDPTDQGASRQSLAQTQPVPSCYIEIRFRLSPFSRQRRAQGMVGDLSAYGFWGDFSVPVPAP